jgi:SAM-dependent methyltransferase
MTRDASRADAGPGARVRRGSGRTLRVTTVLEGARRLVRATPLPAIGAWAVSRLTGRPDVPPVGRVRFGSLRRVEPLSREFGYDRGLPVDRHYIEAFLARQASDVHGRVLEIGDATYTRRYGGDRVTRSDVLHVADAGPDVTIVADLADGRGIPEDSFDCVILTQTLQVIWDVGAAVRTVERILRPGGVVLATMPGISPVSRYDMDRWGYFWSFTSDSARRLFEEVFPASGVRVETHGNPLVATAFLYGLASAELRPEHLEHRDPDYQLLITVRAVKPTAAPAVW